MLLLATALACASTSAPAFARDAAAVIDVAGGWWLYGVLPSAAGPIPMTVKQNGTALEVKLGLPWPGEKRATGRVRPRARAVHIRSLAFPDPDRCDAWRLDGVVSPDGGSMGGTMVVRRWVIHTPGCSVSDVAFSAVRSLCGNGVVDAGEACDPGDMLSSGDCCSPACSIEPSTAACWQEDMRGWPSSRCDGVSALCPPATVGDEDGDGIVDPCDSCPGGPRLSKARVRTDRDRLLIVVRFGLPAAGIDPIVGGVALGLQGGPAVDGNGVALAPADSGIGRWKVIRPGRLWRYDSDYGGVVVTGRVRSAGGQVTVRGTQSTGGLGLRPFRYLTVELDAWHRRGLPCSDMNLATARCLVRGRTTTCR